MFIGFSPLFQVFPYSSDNQSFKTLGITKYGVICYVNTAEIFFAFPSRDNYGLKYHNSFVPQFPHLYEGGQ